MVATGVVGEGPGNTLFVVPPAGNRWYLTDSPADGTLVAQLVTGDLFTYPAGHAQQRETYRWSGVAWVFVTILPAKPAVAELVVTTLEP